MAIAIARYQPHNAFFDESGTHDQSELVVVGGFVSTFDACIAAEIEWKKILAACGFESFHFTDFMARQKPYKGLLNPERDTLMERLTTVIGDISTVGVASGAATFAFSTVRSIMMRYRYVCCN